MTVIRIADVLNGALALGATRGAIVFGQCVRQMTEDESDTAILSFERIEATNGSFVKSTLLNLLLCGKLSLDPDAVLLTPAAPGVPFPFDCYPVVSHCSPDVLVEIDEVFIQRGRNYLLATGPDGAQLTEGEVRGVIDQGLRDTYLEFAPNEELSAAELRRRHPSGVAGTVWNNRLATLHAMRLIRRHRAGREWIYSTVIKRSNIWENGSYAKKPIAVN